MDLDAHQEAVPAADPVEVHQEEEVAVCDQEHLLSRVRTTGTPPHLRMVAMNPHGML